jgi:hypothetical protein
VAVMDVPPVGFPHGLSDVELEDVTAVLAREAERFWAPQMLPELKLALLNAGLQEQSRRETEALLSVSREAAQDAKRAADRTLLVAKATAVIALLTVVFAFLQWVT